MMNLRRVAACSLHLWKRQIATPPLTRTALFSTGDGDSEKAKLFQKLSCLTADYLDRISMEQGVSLTESIGDSGTFFFMFDSYQSELLSFGFHCIHKDRWRLCDREVCVSMKAQGLWRRLKILLGH